MASGALGPSISGLDLALHARIHAAVNAGVPQEQILSHEGLTPESWERADSRWQLALAESADGDGQLLEQWDGAVAAAAGHFTRRVHPIEDEIEAWVDFVRHCQASDDFLEALHAAGLCISDWSQLQARWNARIGSDAELCQRMSECLRGPAAEPPKLSFDPISLPKPLRSVSSANASAIPPAAADNASGEGDKDNEDASDHEGDEDAGEDEAKTALVAAASMLPAFEVPVTAPSDRGSGDAPASQSFPAYDPAQIPEFLRKNALDTPPPPHVLGLAVPLAAPFRPEMVEPARVSVPPSVPEPLSPPGEAPLPLSAHPPRLPGSPTTQPIAVVTPPAMLSSAPAMAVMPPPVWPSSVPVVGGTPPPGDLVSANQPPPVVASQVTPSQPSAPGASVSSLPPVREIRSIAPTEIPLIVQPLPMVSPTMVPLSARPMAVDSPSLRAFSAPASAPMPPPQISVAAQPITPFEGVPIAPHVPITPLPIPPEDLTGSSMASDPMLPVPQLQPMAIMPPPVVPLGVLPVAHQLPISPSDSVQSSHYASAPAFGASPRAALVMPPTVIPDSFAPMPASPLENVPPADHEQKPAAGGLQPHFGPPPSERFMSASGISVSSSSPPPIISAREVHSAIRGSEQYQRALRASDALSAPPEGGGTRAVDLPPEFRAMLRGQPLSPSERPERSRSPQAPVAEPPRVNAPVRFASQSPPVEPAFDGISQSAVSTGGTPHFAPPPVVAPPVIAPPPAVVPRIAPNSPLPATELKPLNKLPWEK